MQDETSAELLVRYRGGDEQAATQMFERYMERLTLLARARLSPRLASRTDPEDIVLSAWRSFFVGASDGRFSLQRSGDLWRLLVSITMHKLYHQARHHTAEIRTVNREQRLDVLPRGFFLADSREPTADEAVALADELEQMMSQLDSFGRRVFELRLQEEQLAEVAAITGRSERTVRRALEAIRQLLASRLGIRLGRDMRKERDDEQEKPPPPGAPLSLPRGPSPDEHAPLAYDDYLLQRLVGAGRMGRVYQARQRSVDRLVAVKYLRKSFLQDQDAVARFIAEAQIVARFQHPGIVKTHGSGMTPRGGYFIAMDLIDGPDLSRIIQAGPVSAADAIRWMTEACDALAHAHEHSIVHCDLKPGNLLLADNGRLFVTDFGLARSLGPESRPVRGIEGTAAYITPEQISSYWGAVSPRTDVYGLGAVLYTLLTGQPPYAGKTLVDVLSQVASSVPVVAPRVIRPNVADDVNEICLRCLMKDPAERFGSMQEIRAALTAVR